MPRAEMPLNPLPTSEAPGKRVLLVVLEEAVLCDGLHEGSASHLGFPALGFFCFPAMSLTGGSRIHAVRQFARMTET